MEVQGNSAFSMNSYGAAASLGAGSGLAARLTTPVRSEPWIGDSVTVSQDALLFTEARLTAQNTPDVRTDKVEALRIQVANGTYKPDSRLIAANLVREEAGLFQR